jgi:hypothetical protein
LKTPRVATVIMGKYPNLADKPFFSRRDSLRSISEYTLNIFACSKSAITSYCAGAGPFEVTARKLCSHTSCSSSDTSWSEKTGAWQCYTLPCRDVNGSRYSRKDWGRKPSSQCSWKILSPSSLGAEVDSIVVSVLFECRYSFRAQLSGTSHFGFRQVLPNVSLLLHQHLTFIVVTQPVSFISIHS